MFSPCSANFIVATILPELITVSIERIHNALRDVTIKSQYALLEINGSINRQIIYRDSAGKLRRVSDSFWFQQSVPKPVLDELPPLDIELIQESFVHHPATGHLEQKFLLRIQEKENSLTDDEKVWVPVSVFQVVESGQGLAYGRIDVDTPVNFSEPLDFTGVIRFPNRPYPWLNGIISGKIRYCDVDGRVGEFRFEKEIDFIDSLQQPHASEQQLRIDGEIASYSFFQSSHRQTWIFTVKVKYQWDLVEKKEVRCRAVPDDARADANQPDSLIIQTADQVSECSQQISRRLFLPLDLNLTAIHCSIENYDEKPSRTSLVLTARFLIEIYGIDPFNQEVYSVFRDELIELIPLPSLIRVKPDGLKFQSALTPVIGPFSPQGRGISLMVFFEYRASVCRNEYHRVETNKEANGAVFRVQSLQNRHRFFMTGEGSIPLNPGDVSEMKDIAVNLIRCRAVPENAWLKWEGTVEVAVSFIDRRNDFRSEIFNLMLVQAFDWDAIHENLEISCREIVENQTLLPLENRYHFSCLLRLECCLLKEERVKLSLYCAPPPERKQLKDDNTNESIVLPQIEKRVGNGQFIVGLEETLSFPGIEPIEIVAKHLNLTDVVCERLSDRLLISGIQEWSLQFWNKSNFFENKTFKIPFWRYIPPAGPWLPGCRTGRLSHQILEYDIALLKKRLFSSCKGRLTVRFEVSFPEENGE